MNYNEIVQRLKDTVYKWENIQEICNLIILAAVLWNSSDIHIEPLTSYVRLRYRLDGELVEILEYQNFLHSWIVARFKIMSDLKIDESRIPQDWRLSTTIEWKSLDLRVSTLPTVHGEKIVMRIVDKSKKIPKLEELWIEWKNWKLIQKAISLPNWIILTSWPTGSWKSTTLFGLLSQFDPEQKNISTLEDPVEYRIKWVNHTQINPDINFTFARGLRSLLRQDPDIIMVWEIRDEETAKLAVEASITWHIVFSTIHTNSAVHTIQRIVNLGIDPLLITSSLRMIISQRLARKLCVHCKEKYEASDKVRDFFIKNVWKYIKNKEKIELYKAKEWGCPHCNGTGYKWRTWFYEILEMTEGLEKLILNNSSKIQLEIQAVWDWMVPIKQDWLIKVLLGETSLEELLSVLWW